MTNNASFNYVNLYYYYNTELCWKYFERAFESILSRLNRELGKNFRMHYFSCENKFECRKNCVVKKQTRWSIFAFRILAKYTWLQTFLPTCVRVQHPGQQHSAQRVRHEAGFRMPMRAQQLAHRLYRSFHSRTDGHHLSHHIHSINFISVTTTTKIKICACIATYGHSIRNTSTSLGNPAITANLCVKNGYITWNHYRWMGIEPK